MTTDLEKLRVLTAFRAMPRTLHSDVLADGTIARRFRIDTSRATRLTDECVIDSKMLFAAFRNAADAKPPIPIIDQAGVALNTTVRIDADGTGVIEIGSRGWRFDHSALLVTDPVRRLAMLDAALMRHPLCQRDATELRVRVARPEYADDDFAYALRVLASSPEAFSTRLRTKLAIRQVGEEESRPAGWGPQAGSPPSIELGTRKSARRVSTRRSPPRGPTARTTRSSPP
jgi:hypothetical protein